MIAYVLAGGKGSRLAPWHAPKCLLPINGVPMLQRIIEHLRASGKVEQVVVCTGYRHGDVEASVRAHGWTTGYVAISRSGEDAPMGVRLLNAHTTRFAPRSLIVYSDELADVDLSLLLRVHEEKQGREMTFAATYAVAPGGSVEDAVGGPRIVEGKSVLVNIGFVVADLLAWNHLAPEYGVSDWVNRVRDRVGDVGLYYHGGKRATVNSLADLQHAEEVWR